MGAEPYAHWSLQTEFSYEAQSTGRVFTNLSATGDDNLNEEGSYLRLGAEAGSEVLGGATAALGGINAGVGVGLGDWVPSLAVTLLAGDFSFNSLGLGASLDWDFSDAWTATFSMGGEDIGYSPFPPP